jgi:hypothetical protein
MKFKKLFHSIKEKFQHQNKSAVENDLNEYDKMRIETVLKKEMSNRMAKDRWARNNLEKGNNRDISAI